jgi:DNA/RNA endonuclease YhcR with UshA esterase domain
MIEKPKLLALVIIITLAGIIGIYSYAVLIEAKTISIADLGPKYIGSMVEVEGHITEVDAWPDGDLGFVLVDYESGKTVDVNVDSEAVSNVQNQEKLIPGAKIRVAGLVEEYKGNLLIHVRSSEGIKLLKTAASNVHPLEIILKRPEVFQGVQVVVRGSVWDIEGIESLEAVTFTLQNSSGGRYYSVSCIVFNSTQLQDMDSMRIHNGDEIFFTGIFEYYEQKGTWQIQSNDGKEDIVKVV